MDTSKHDMGALFVQLGLPGDADSVSAFIDRHKLVRDAGSLADADFWNEAQAMFLRESIADDSDWSEVVDQLDAALRH